jgi:hypothetical protein
MAGGAVLEFKDAPKKICLLDTELRYLNAAFRPAKHSCKSDEQYLAQVMACIDIARIRYRLKYNEEIAHPNTPKTIRTFGRIHISMNRKDWSTQTRFPWGLPELDGRGGALPPNFHHHKTGTNDAEFSQRRC